MALTRRHIVAIGGVGVLGGLLWTMEQWEQRRYVPVTVRNTDTVAHEIRLVLQGDFADQETQTTVAAGGQTTLKTSLPKLDYPHDFQLAIGVDGEIRTTFTDSLRRWEPYVITIEEPESISITQEQR